MDELTHSVTVTVNGKYPHGEKQHATVTMSGDGSLDHMLSTFRAALLAAGFSADIAAKLDCAA
jgi:hypothetical protein